MNSTNVQLWLHTDNWSIVATIFMVLVTILALLTNLTVIIIIVKNSHLRYTLTNVFVASLCTADFLASLLILPLGIIVFVEKQWPWNQSICTAVGFLNSFFIFASILNICLISMERCYSIRSPMHHAGNMTLTKTLIVVLCIWIKAGLLAALPVFGWNSYHYQPNKAQCTYIWDDHGDGKFFVFFTGFVCFFIPGCVIITMYSVIFSIAQSAAVQVHPMSTASTQSSHTVPVNCVSTITTATVARQQLTTPYKRRTHLKALKTLVIIILVYFLLWGPYFIIQLCNAAGIDVIHKTVEVIITWLGYSSFVMNPFLYGWMNRPIRDEIFIFLKSRLCCYDTNMDDMRMASASLENIFRIIDREEPLTITPVGENRATCQRKSDRQI